MNGLSGPPVADLGVLALAAVAAHLGRDESGFQACMLASCIDALRVAGGERDRRLLRVADAFALDRGELLTLALILAADTDAMVARALAEAQAPLGGSRPLLGFAATVFECVGASVAGLAFGAAARAGLLTLATMPAAGSEAAALAERALAIPTPLAAALCGSDAEFDCVSLRPAPPLPLPHEVRHEARSRAALLRDRPNAGLIVRSPSLAEAFAVAQQVASMLGLRLARIEGKPPPGLAPWLVASGRLPVFSADPAPGERWSLPPLGSYAGPWLVVCATEGAIEADVPGDEWALPIPEPRARARLWIAGGLERRDARRAASSFRQGAGRIAEIAARARLIAARRGARPSWPDVAQAMAGSAGTLDAHARRSAATVTDNALVAPPALRRALADLAARAHMRATLADGLGPALTARYRPGVRALMTGPPGTGKTLAAHWLATRLGLPLYRADSAALTSKYYGETEKNLSGLFAAAEHADVVLFFDEADALFAARTEIGDANDRFANAQTNYLLQRIEEYDGIVLLASNSRDRFDPAFVRRLDAILDFPMPEALARRDLWLAHLGQGHALTSHEFDRLAVAIDLAGGHIRNIVLAAAARARAERRLIGWSDIVHGVAHEYGKLGRMPPELRP